MTEINKWTQVVPASTNLVVGKVGLHEIVHKNLNIGDLPYNGTANGNPNSMQMDDFGSKFADQATTNMLDPKAFLLSKEQAIALGKSCRKSAVSNLAQLPLTPNRWDILDLLNIWSDKPDGTGGSDAGSGEDGGSGWND